MKTSLPFWLFLTFCFSIFAGRADQPLPRDQWGAPLVNVMHIHGRWIIAGKKQTITLDDKNLAIGVQAQSAVWKMVPSGADDLLVRVNGKEFPLRLADAKEISIKPYDTGFKTGVEIVLRDWSIPKTGPSSGNAGLTLYLTICLQGNDEDLVFDIAAQEGNATVRQLDWPTALDARDIDYTVLSNNKGDLLPRNWPKPYFPIRAVNPDGTAKEGDHSVLQSHVIEDWSMSWWGFQKGKSAMMVIVETPDDAAYQFDHPAGGPTVIGPRWRATLGKFGYMRTARMCFFENGNYVTMAKRYRQYVMDTGLFVPLKEKIARTPLLAGLIGTPQVRMSILHNMNPDSDRYASTPHYTLVTFDERAKQLRALKAAGFPHALAVVSGWAHLGYDRQHPDPLPPAEAGGGWDGMKRLADTCAELGYPFILHDQYRDYYVDAPSYNPDLAVHEEDDSLPPTAFAGSRYGDSKEGQIPFMRHWDGGKQAYLNSLFQLGHLEKNYQSIFAHGIHPQGIYIDVIGYVPPDEDFNPEHPITRTEAMRGQADLLNWARHNLGFTSTEAGSDWVVPYVDSVNQSGSNPKNIPVPLYELVYHDAMLVSFGLGKNDDEKNLLLGMLYGGVPELSADISKMKPSSLALIKQMAALHKRVGLLEMTNHEFLDPKYRKERTTFADGTTVTVDWDTDTVAVQPPLK
ncbi:MAG TPA: DUF5696 domain-containing protein [Candidatus Methylacidiphilales bacterium]|nr:DUF5696 domain-containing protein [Candidatus Methylacidiphilales bacterium]